MKKHTLKPAYFSCPFIAAQFVGLNYGAEKFADETYQSRAVVYNKLNPDNDSNHLSLRDAVLLTDKSKDTSIVEAMCHQAGGVFVKLPESVACDEELSDQMMKLSEQLGCAMGEVRSARADGLIDPAEFDVISTKLLATVKEVLALKKVVKSQVRELPVPASK